MATRQHLFHMGLSTKNNYFDMMTTSELIKPGFHTTWKVQAMEIVPSEDLYDVPIEKRNCRFPEEASELTIFKIYSKKACQFECHLKKAIKTCRCVPWFVPPEPSENRHVICDVYGNMCFKEMMEKYGSLICLTFSSNNSGSMVKFRSSSKKSDSSEVQLTVKLASKALSSSILC